MKYHLPKALALTCIACLLSLTEFVRADSFWNTILPATCGTRLMSDAPVDYGVFYTRVIRLAHSGTANGRLIATYEHFPVQPTSFVIYQSDDDGRSWSKLSTAPGGHMPAPWAFTGEPHLYELPTRCGDLAAGTILITGSTVCDNPVSKRLQQRLEVYASSDQGRTWNYRGTIDSTTGTEGNIWEPNLQVSSTGRLVAYFSDERQQPKYSQTLGLRISDDGGKTWGKEQLVVGVPDGAQRPGMAVTQRLPSGQYVMSYEWVNGTENPAYIRFSSDGINWGDPTQRGIPVQTASGSFLGGTPFLTWTPFGGPKGTLVVNARQLSKTASQDREIFTNSNLGNGPWVAQPSPVQWQGNQEFDGWSMGMIPTADGRGIIQLASSYVGNSQNEVLVGRVPLLIPGMDYSIQNSNSHLALSIPAVNSTPGTPLVQLTLKSGANQIWRLKDLGDGTFGITNPASGMAMDDFGFKTNNGALVAAYTSNFLRVQQWRFLPCSDGSVRMLNVNANRVLGVWEKSLVSGAQLPFWDDDGTTDHRWFFGPAK